MTCVAYLIHGTYATNAPWTGPGATFYEALQAKFGNDLAIRTFSWDGKNAFSSRHEAIHRLSNELDTVAAEREFRDIYLVAHSHGGNIALHATSQMQHGERITALVSLGTPYLRVAPKSWAPPALLSFGLSFWLSLGLSAFVPRDFSGTSVILFLLLLPTMYWLLVRAKRRSYALSSLPTGRGGAISLPILCIRHGGDEASLWLTLLSIPRACERVLGMIGRTVVGGKLIRTLLKLALLSFGISAVFLFTTAIPFIPFLLFTLVALAFLLPIFSAVGTLLTSHRFGFGGRTSLESFFVDIELAGRPWIGDPLESKYSGLLGMFRSSSLRPFKIVTPHSLGYSDPKAINRVCSWLEMISR